MYIPVSRCSQDPRRFEVRFTRRLLEGHRREGHGWPEAGGVLVEICSGLFLWQIQNFVAFFLDLQIFWQRWLGDFSIFFHFCFHLVSFSATANLKTPISSVFILFQWCAEVMYDTWPMTQPDGVVLQMNLWWQYWCTVGCHLESSWTTRRTVPLPTSPHTLRNSWPIPMDYLQWGNPASLISCLWPTVCQNMFRYTWAHI